MYNLHHQNIVNNVQKIHKILIFKNTTKRQNNMTNQNNVLYTTMLIMLQPGTSGNAKYCGNKQKKKQLH